MPYMQPNMDQSRQAQMMALRNLPDRLLVAMAQSDAGPFAPALVQAELVRRRPGLQSILQQDGQSNPAVLGAQSRPAALMPQGAMPMAPQGPPPGMMAPPAGPVSPGIDEPPAVEGAGGEPQMIDPGGFSPGGWGGAPTGGIAPNMGLMSAGRDAIMAGSDQALQVAGIGEDDPKRDALMALAKAGFGMAAGRSPSAIQNIAGGALLGLSDYEAARERAVRNQLRNAQIQLAHQDRQDNIQLRLAQIQQAMQDHSLDREQKATLAREANELRRELGQAANETRREIAGMNAGIRQDSLELRRQMLEQGKQYAPPEAQKLMQLRDSLPEGHPDRETIQAILENRAVQKGAVTQSQMAGMRERFVRQAQGIVDPETGQKKYPTPEDQAAYADEQMRAATQAPLRGTPSVSTPQAFSSPLATELPTPQPSRLQGIPMTPETTRVPTPTAPPPKQTRLPSVAPTPDTIKKAQEFLVYHEAIDPKIDALIGELKQEKASGQMSGRVGVVGAAKQAWNETAGQVFGIDRPAEDFRQRMRILQNDLTRTLKFDSQISNEERRRIEGLMPSLDVFGSRDAAIIKLENLRKTLAARRQINADLLSGGGVRTATPPVPSTQEGLSKLSDEEVLRRLGIR